MIKTQKKHRLVSVKHMLLRGDEQGLEDCLKQSQGGTQINTAYIERLNGTVRERLASLTRKCRHASRRLEAFQWGMYLIGCTYNLCWSHHQLGQTPAQAAELTDHVWSLQEVLTYKVPPDTCSSKLRKPNTVFSFRLLRSPKEEEEGHPNTLSFFSK